MNKVLTVFYIEKALIVITGIILLMLFFNGDSIDLYWFIILIFALIFGYITKKVGIKKEIYTGFIWGYFLGFIGLIIVCILPTEVKENKKENENINNKYENLERLQKLKESGAITDVEFEIEKQKLLR